MELVYLWVEEYKNIHRQGFNFSPRFNCEYDPDTNELTIDENDDYIENFFGDNINVTAIVGKNGSGKSSILELIMDFSNDSEKIYGALYLIEEDEELTLYCSNVQERIQLNSEIEQIEFKKKSSSRTKERKRLNYAYLSLSPFVNNMDYLYGSITEKQYLASIYNYRNDYKNKTFNYTDFYLRMIPKIPSLLENEHIQKLFHVQGYPQYLVIKINKYVRELFPDEFSQICSLLTEIEASDKSYTYELLLGNDKGFDAIEFLNQKVEQEKKKLEEEIYKIDEKLKKDEAKGLMPEPPPRRKSEFDNMLYDKPYGNTGNDESIQSKMNRATNSRINNNRKKINNYNKEIEKLGTFEFNLTHNKNKGDTFYFSSGELVLLFYIEKLLYIAKSNNEMIILIDENELFLHPNWQKKFLLFLSNVFSNGKNKRQIIISSHSPFLISDIPRNNIIFLNNGKNDKGTKDKQTFGANIHTLLSDSFFMEDGLMGEFAKNKIQEIMDFLNNKKNIEEISTKEKDIKQVIETIGEPFLKQKLLQMYYQKFKDEEAKEARKNELLAEKKRIEEELRSL